MWPVVWASAALGALGSAQLPAVAIKSCFVEIVVGFRLSSLLAGSAAMQDLGQNAQHSKEVHHELFSWVPQVGQVGFAASLKGGCLVWLGQAYPIKGSCLHTTCFYTTTFSIFVNRLTQCSVWQGILYIKELLLLRRSSQGEQDGLPQTLVLNSFADQRAVRK